MIERTARHIVANLFSRIRTGELVIVEKGERHVYGSGLPTATVVIHSGDVWARLARGGRGLAETYIDGLWDSPDVTAVIRVAALNIVGIDEVRRRLTPLRAPYQTVRGALRRNTPVQSRKDISKHYDLGNELFELMLDPTMMYSCGLFERPGMTLEEASIAKLERVCERLDVGPEDHVLEIGTGWGGFAVHAAATRGCRVTTTTISREQHDYALARVRETGVEDRVTVLLDDYRELHGTYDKLVSIEMIEAVGWKDFPTFFARCSELLRPDGAMFLQAITIDDRAYELEKASKTFIRTYIFPNGCLPSVEVIARNVARRTDLTTVSLEDHTAHYGETLRRWRANFDRAGARLEELGYDDRFRRLWRLYLGYVEAGFDERRIGLVQMVLAKPEWRAAGPATVEPAAAPIAVAAG